MHGNRRKPYAVVLTQKYELVDGKAVQKRKYLGYYPTKKEALIALSKYNEAPYDTEATFKTVYERWKETKKVSDASLNVYDKAFERFSALHDKSFAQLRTADYERVIASSECSQTSKHRMKTLLNQMYAYGLKYDLCQANYAQRFTVSQPDTIIERKPFSDEEIKTLWESDDPSAKIALIMIYTGVRINELLKMEYDGEYLHGGSKTKAGMNRIVPVRKKIRPLMDYERTSYNKFYADVSKYLKTMNHLPHDCRVTFTTRYKYKDPTALKLILGHHINDITKAVYTKYTASELMDFVESVDY